MLLLMYFYLIANIKILKKVPFMNIFIRSRKEIEYLIDTKTKPVLEPWSLISIWNTFRLLTLKNIEIIKSLGCKEFLDLKFGDFTDKEERDASSESDIILFNETHASQTIQFLDSLSTETLIIHCAAGISRSSAIGLFACRYLKLNEQEFLDNHSHILPNYYILSILNKVSNINKDYASFWETEEKKELRRKMMSFRT